MMNFPEDEVSSSGGQGKNWFMDSEELRKNLWLCRLSYKNGMSLLRID